MGYTEDKSVLLFAPASWNENFPAKLILCISGEFLTVQQGLQKNVSTVHSTEYTDASSWKG